MYEKQSLPFVLNASLNWPFWLIFRLYVD